ncbi:PREDICTED: histone H2B subacrosomal variant-like [Miniopterus natalensis]|uniref:histone H2B subacrosomal variant-like n=1 Tax=Miniopterus natalensis TaxID=291302 RepID=UPI0007A6C3F9|nr:PREDICTED: histone H2B subacrosomal variant-like [Miniopterus natalensis]
MAKSTTKKNKCSRNRRSSRKKSHPCADFNRNYSLYIRRVLKEVDPQKSISSDTLDIMNSVINDIFERISTQAYNLMCFRNRCTLTHEDIQKAMYMLFPGKRAKYAVTFGSEAVQRYAHSKNNSPA